MFNYPFSSLDYPIINSLVININERLIHNFISILINKSAIRYNSLN